MGNRYRIEFNPLSGTWYVERYNVMSGFWQLVYSAASKSLCVQWCDRNSF